MFRHCLVVVLFLVATPSTAQETKPATKAERSENVELTDRLKRVVCIKLEKLLQFKDSKEFKKYGFGAGGPYHKWIEEVERLHNSKKPKEIPFVVRVAPGELMQLSSDFMKHGRETDYIKQTLPELKKTIDYAGYLRNKELEKRRKAARKQQEKYLAIVMKKRKWSDATGKFSTVATVVKFGDGKVTMTKEDGETVTLPISKLSENDRKLLNKADPTPNRNGGNDRGRK